MGARKIFRVLGFNLILMKETNADAHGEGSTLDAASCKRKGPMEA